MANHNPEAELLQIFIEEATDLLLALSVTLRAWQDNLYDFTKIAELKRDLHTLKGSARMVGQSAIGSLAHEIETICEALVKKTIPIERQIFELILLAQDRINLMIESLKKNEALPDTKDLLTAFQQYLPQKTSNVGTTNIKTESASKKQDTHPDEKQEIIRIRADLLEQINNLSTENNLLRANLEQQLGKVNVNLQDVKDRIRHLGEQLGLLRDELETVEAKDQKQFQIIEQLCHALIETHVDILKILKTLIEENTSIETLYLHQARVSTELQLRLSHTRLVPFESIIPRLSRIARQIAQELKKQIDFKVLKSQGEMDRNVLEHLIPSLEHILRNALDHGIENSEIRKAKGKPEVGKIEISFIHNGSTVAIMISDDGAGINSQAIKQKAIQLGLITADTHISEEEAIRYILEPGFSTSDKVSEISGRGVGMDVVNMAIKEMGGTLKIESILGKGTTMILRLPFTISLNRILLFKIQSETYGILLANIESIANIAPDNIKQKIFEHNDIPYHQIYLADLLNPNARENDSSILKRSSYPLLLFSDEDFHLAFLVDDILYTRDLVVQGLGGQFKMTDILSGATLLGDGTVVYILDPFTLSAKAKTYLEKSNSLFQIHEQPAKQKAEVKSNPLVFIIDDSASSRSVSKRCLEQQQYQVITAKDGLEGLQKLESYHPDLILLDIDMPRMDGFEFALTLKKDKNLKNIPIIVITSRIIEHKQRAEALKLSYLVEKPYQDEDLLKLIQKVLGKNHD